MKVGQRGFDESLPRHDGLLVGSLHEHGGLLLQEHHDVGALLHLARAGGPLDQRQQADKQHPGAGGEVEDLDLALHVRLPGQQLGEDGELVVDLLEHHLDEDAEGHLGQSEMSIRSRDHVWTNERSLLTM